MSVPTSSLIRLPRPNWRVTPRRNEHRPGSNRSRRGQRRPEVERLRARRVPGGRLRARPPARPQAEGLRRRHQRHPARDQTPLSQLPDHRPPFSTGPRLLRSEDHRDLHLPRQPAGDGGRRQRRRRARDRRSADPAGQRLRHARAGCPAARLHHQRSLLRHRCQAGDRPRPGAARPGDAARAHHRRSRHPVSRGSDPDPAGGEVRRALQSDHRARDLPADDGAPPGDRQVRSGARLRGVLSPLARRAPPSARWSCWSRWTCSSSWSPSWPAASRASRPTTRRPCAGRACGATWRRSIARRRPGRCAPSNALILAALLLPPLRDSLDPDSNGVRDVGQLVAQAIAPALEHLRPSRRDSELARQILLALRHLLPSKNPRRRKTKVNGGVRRRSAAARRDRPRRRVRRPDAGRPPHPARGDRPRRGGHRRAPSPAAKKKSPRSSTSTTIGTAVAIAAEIADKTGARPHQTEARTGGEGPRRRRARPWRPPAPSASPPMNLAALAAAAARARHPRPPAGLPGRRGRSAAPGAAPSRLYA